MSYAFPPDLNRLVQQKMASGVYESENELLVDAIHALDELHEQHGRLRTEIQGRLKSCGKGLSTPFDLAEFGAKSRQLLSDNE